jgi:hypothetical protein
MSAPRSSRIQPREFLGMRPRFAFWTGAVVLLAFLIREYFVLVTVIDIPIRGDVRDYVVYALNLYRHCIFSMSSQANITPIPDSYRSPGYPWLLALCMWLRPSGGGWYHLALQIQVLLGTDTVWLTALLARKWLGIGWAIAAGLLLAIWPHHVAATGALLSEVAFGFTLMAGLYCFALATESRGSTALVLSASFFGYAYLINPLIALFPPVLALMAWREKRRHAALLFFGIFLVPVLAFSWRNSQLDDDGAIAGRPGRAVVNFVQGSWPQYGSAWQGQLSGDPTSVSNMEAIGLEIQQLNDTPAIGMATISARTSKDPGHYAAWYLWRKPLLLWSWDVQIGGSGIYSLAVQHSPLDANPLLRSSTAALRVLNPFLSLLALGGMLAIFIGGQLRKPWAPAVALPTAAIAIYLTSVHTVFQADPRYANAYRGIEILLVFTALKLLADACLHWKAKRKPQTH